MEFQHTPIMVNEVVSFLDPKLGQTIIDATAGGGGHLAALKKVCSDCQFIALDQDEEAIEVLKDRFKDITIVHDNFRNIVLDLKKLGINKVDAIFADLGVSSHQLDTRRGFSFLRDELLDMRMDFRQSLTAKMIVNNWSEDKLRDIFARYGQERYTKPIARAIVKAREIDPIETTGRLVEIIKKATPPGYRQNQSHHFATNTFRALRMAVNDELGALESFLRQIPSLGPKKVVFLTFHSLEDHMVKNAMRSWRGEIIDIKPSEQEVAQNPRARSARLRGFVFSL